MDPIAEEGMVLFVIPDTVRTGRRSILSSAMGYISRRPKSLEGKS
jgi:hypothetical protein